MEARNQSYREKADKFAARPITGNTYTEKTENLTNAIALRTQIENPTDEDKRKIAHHYHCLLDLEASTNYSSAERREKYLQGAIHYRKHIKIKSPTDRLSLANCYALLAASYGGDARYTDNKRDRNYAKAISILVNYCKDYPKDYDSKRELSKIYAVTLDFKSAIAELEKIPDLTTKDILTLSNYYIEVANREPATANSSTKRLAAYSKAIELLMPLNEYADKDIQGALTKASQAKLMNMAAIHQANRKARAAKKQTPDGDSSSSDSESSLRNNSVFAKPAARPVPAPEWKDKNEKTKSRKSR